MQDLLSNTMMWLQDTGILKKLSDDALNPPMAIPDPKVRTNQPLTTMQLGGAMVVQVVGLAFAIIAFIGELTKKKLNSNRRYI